MDNKTCILCDALDENDLPNNYSTILTLIYITILLNWYTNRLYIYNHINKYIILNVVIIVEYSNESHSIQP